MGIQNRDGALYFATGIDNSGLYSGRQEAMGIIKAMAGEITAFDVFGGIGISAGIAFAQAAKEAYNFEKQFQQSMKEVATLSSGIKGSLTDFMNSVIDITREIPVGAVESAKALYQIVSAGHDGADAMNILKVSAKAAIGGVTETATSADAITTILNAYKKGASEAENISDMLFTTAKLGKTTMGELGRSIAQAAPIASSFGIDIEDVLAAVVSITKQGVPTAEAMTKIRAAIMGTANHLGDAAFSGRSFQEALQLIYNEANGSTTKMKELLGTDEALQAALMITGQNAVGAASDLEQMKNASGAAEAAFKEMASSAENQMKLLGNNITAYLRPLGQEILKEISSVAQSMNEAFTNGSAQEALKNIGTLIVVVTTALAGYKGAILAVNIAKSIQLSISNAITKQIEIEKAAEYLLMLQQQASGNTSKALQVTMVNNMSKRTLLTKAIKAQTIAQLKNAAAMLTNPYVLAAAAFAGLGYAVYKCATAETEAERVQKRYNKVIEEQAQQLDDLKNKTNSLVSVVQDENSTQYDKVKAYKQLQALMPTVFSNMDIETLKLMDHLSLNKQINNEINRRERIGAKTNLILAQNKLASVDSRLNKATKEQAESPSGQKAAVLQKIQEEKKIAEEELKVAQKRVDDILNIQKQAKEEDKKENKKAEIQNKAFWTKQKDDATKALDSISSAQKKQMDAGKFKGIDSAVVTAYKENVKKLKEAEKELKVYDSSSKQDDQAHKLREEQEKYKLLLDKQNREQQRMKEDSANELEQLEINKLKESSEKILKQRALNHKLELQAIEREADDKKLQEIEKARSAFEANPQNKKKTFNASEYVKSEPVKKQFAAFDKAANEKKETTDLKYNRGDDLADLLNEYQDYTDKRISIERKFNEDIATLQEQRKQAVKNGDTEQVEQIDRSIAQATKNKGMELMGLDYDKLKESPEYVRAFENLKETSSETLNSLLTQLENAKQTAAQVLSPDQLREYTSTIQSIMDELDSRNPFQSLSDKKKELAEAEEELANAQRELENAKQTAEAVKGGTKIENGVKSSKFNEKTGKIDSTKTYLSEAQALDKVKDKTDKYNKAKDNVVKTSDKVKKAEKDVKSQIDDLCNAMNDLGNSIGGQAGEIISLISDIGSFTMFAMEGVKAAADTSANAISTVEKASVILAIISAAVQVATKIAKLFKGESDEEKRKKQIDFYNQIISIYDKIIEKQKESIKFGYGFSSIESAKKAMEDLNKQTEYYRKIANTSSKMFVGDKSLQYIKAMKELGVDVKESLLGIATSDELSQLSAKQLEYIRDNYKELWASLKDEQRDALQAIIDAEDKSKKIVDEWKESITGISYDSFYTEFIDTLSDMDSSAEDMANNFGDYLRKSILAAMVAKEFQKDIDNLYEMWVAAGDEKSDGGIEITVDEAKKIQQKQKELTEAMIKRREEMEKAYGFDSSTSSQDSTKKGFANMSQDSADELNGRFTALQILNEEIKNQNVLQTGIQQGILQKLEFLYNFNYSSSTEMRDMMADVLNYLDDIKKDTSHLYFIRESLHKIENNTKGLSTK